MGVEVKMSLEKVISTFQGLLEKVMNFLHQLIWISNCIKSRIKFIIFIEAA